MPEMIHIIFHGVYDEVVIEIHLLVKKIVIIDLDYYIINV